MTTLHVPDMTCQHCVATITKLVQQADPQAQIQIDLSQHRVAVEGKLNNAELISLLEDAGYTPAEQ
ncbi:Heavy metal transport/detoxification protein [Tolumonas auensis DSM 9187]|uniref:Heavy metal transport/detoxification protein n=1 Tax=Tolumonas auensis (strain DSM 9187 / NBRC 110442 / TA 4) TaxID=595494 RepID=C4LAL3_TOLAT|nr:heavy-metal-associated domain-containing protein [Tolumonas auensis]ACQ92217.1 Heavy metal transport/detoxification protein [Tolumonas auensis DSM 9187]